MVGMKKNVHRSSLVKSLTQHLSTEMGSASTKLNKFQLIQFIEIEQIEKKPFSNQHHHLQARCCAAQKRICFTQK
jgi:hypothetical protein